MVSHWSLSDSTCILADLNNAVVWMVSTRLLIIKSSSLCINFLVSLLRAPITIGKSSLSYSTVFQYPEKIIYLSFRFLSILLLGQQGQKNPQFSKFSILLFVCVCVCVCVCVRVCDYYTVWSSGRV